MKRREFVKISSVAGLGILGFPNVAFQDDPNPQHSKYELVGPIDKLTIQGWKYGAREIKGDDLPEGQDMLNFVMFPYKWRKQENLENVYQFLRAMARPTNPGDPSVFINEVELCEGDPCEGARRGRLVTEVPYGSAYDLSHQTIEILGDEYHVPEVPLGEFAIHKWNGNLPEMTNFYLMKQNDTGMSFCEAGNNQMNVLLRGPVYQGHLI